MAYKLQVSFPNSFHPAWKNLIDQLDQVEDRSYILDRKGWIDSELAKFNCRNLHGTAYIEFNTEADSIMFILAWS